MAIAQKQYSTDPGWTAYLNDANGWIDVSTAIGPIKLYGKITGGSSIGPFTMTATTVNSFTATAANNSAVLTSVSSFTGIVIGTVASTITGLSSIIPPLTKVVSIDTVGNTITMSNAATAAGTGITLKVNVGMATYVPATADVSSTGVYGCEVAIHWDNTNTLITLVPSRSASNDTITLDPNLTGALE